MTGVPGYIVAVKTVAKGGGGGYVGGHGGGGAAAADMKSSIRAGAVAPADYLRPAAAAPRHGNEASEADAVEARKAILTEAAIMALVDYHPNVLGLIGVVSSGSPLLLLVPYCEHGELLAFVKKTRLADFEKLRIAAEIACGMDHLGTTKPCSLV